MRAADDALRARHAGRVSAVRRTPASRRDGRVVVRACCSRCRRCSSSTAGWRGRTRSRCCSAGSRTPRSSAICERTRRGARGGAALLRGLLRRWRRGCIRSSGRSSLAPFVWAFMRLRRVRGAATRRRHSRALAIWRSPTGARDRRARAAARCSRNPQSLRGKSGIDVPNVETLIGVVVRVARHAVTAPWSCCAWRLRRWRRARRLAARCRRREPACSASRSRSPRVVRDAPDVELQPDHRSHAICCPSCRCCCSRWRRAPCGSRTRVGVADAASRRGASALAMALPCVALAVHSPLAAMLRHPNPQTLHFVLPHSTFVPSKNPYLPYVGGHPAVAVLGDVSRSAAGQRAHRGRAVLLRKLRLGRAALGATGRQAVVPGYLTGLCVERALRRDAAGRAFRFAQCRASRRRRGAGGAAAIDYVVWQKPYRATSRKARRVDRRGHRACEAACATSSARRLRGRAARSRFRIPRDTPRPMLLGKRIIVVMPAYNAGTHARGDVARAAARHRRRGHRRRRRQRRRHGRGRAPARASTSSCTRTTRATAATRRPATREALARGADIVVMVHPDYQYTPRLVPAMAGMIASGIYDMVLGSRILGGGALRRRHAALEVRRQPRC